MSAISIDRGNELNRADRFSVRLAVAIGESADAAEPWGIASDVSRGGLFVRTGRTRERGESLRLWFVDGRDLRPLDARVVWQTESGVGVRFEDESFYRWAFERTTR